jgi:hypothetical protein
VFEQSTGRNLKPFFDFWLYQPVFNYIEVYDFSVQKTSKGYKTAVVIRQRSIGTDSLPRNLRLELGFYGKRKHTIRTITISGKWTYDTLTLDFKPLLVLPDPNEYIADATTYQLFTVDSVGNYYFDYEFVQIFVRGYKKSTPLRVQANWLPPDGKFPKGYLIQQNYYWTVSFLPGSKLNALAKFYLTTLMDLNFTHITEEQLKDLVMFYRPNPYSEWQIIPTKVDIQGDGLIVEKLLPGEYVFGLKR